MYKSENGNTAHPLNYFVPDFGRDHDISSTYNSLKAAEGITKKEWIYKKPESDKNPDGSSKTDYRIPDFGLEEDMKQSAASISQQEAIHGKWVPVQDDNGVWIVPEAAKSKSYSHASLLQL
jgi:hypothetical protein